MQCEYAFLCDYAAQDASGKTNALGVGWSALTTPDVPCTHEQAAFVARLTGSVAEAGSKKVSFRLIDADGADVLDPMEADLDFLVDEQSLVGRLDFLAVLSGVVFPKYGEYAFHLVVDGTEMARAAFTVLKPPATTA